MKHFVYSIYIYIYLKKYIYTHDRATRFQVTLSLFQLSSNLQRTVMVKKPRNVKGRCMSEI